MYCRGIPIRCCQTDLCVLNTNNELVSRVKSILEPQF